MMTTSEHNQRRDNVLNESNSYIQGRQAYFAGRSAGEVPPDVDSLNDWQSGWFDAQTEAAVRTEVVESTVDGTPW